MTQSDSSLISAYEFDDTAWMLTLIFRSTGEARTYEDFPPELFAEFEAAKSKGQFFNSRIKAQFTVVKGGKVDPEAVAPVKQQLAAAVADDTLISDDDIRAAHPDYKREEVGVTFPMPQAEPEIMSPEQAAAIIAPKSARADELTARLHKLAATKIEVKDKASQTAMENHLVLLTGARRAVFDVVDPYREIAYRAYEAVQRLNKARLDPADEAIKAGKIVLNAYISAEQEKARQEQRRLQAAADAQAEAERIKRTEELRLQAAQEHQERGDTAAAEASLFSEEIQAPPVYTPAVRVEEPTSTLGGRANWKAEVADFEEVVLDVAEGIKAMRAGGSLMGHAPTSILTVNASGLKALATANKEHFRFPGLRAWDDRVIVTKQKGS